jgi:hypothetical protein
MELVSQIMPEFTEACINKHFQSKGGMDRPDVSVLEKGYALVRELSVLPEFGYCQKPYGEMHPDWHAVRMKIPPSYRTAYMLYTFVVFTTKEVEGRPLNEVDSIIATYCVSGDADHPCHASANGLCRHCAANVIACQNIVRPAAVDVKVF